MKCKVCKKATNWDESYGLRKFIVCPKCMAEIAKATNNNFAIALNAVFAIGHIKEKQIAIKTYKS